MPISVVVGGQFGSEGKGKVAHFIAQTRQAEVAVRVGGPNSGHTVVATNGEAIVFKHLPTACILEDVTCVVPPGSYLKVATLLKEIEVAELSPNRVKVDPFSWVVTAEDEISEANGSLVRSIGSTASGMGAAVVRRISRAAAGTFAKDVAELKPFLANTSAYLSTALNQRKRVVVEGTQGFGLSLLHSQAYPFCTSRDTVASAFLSEAGLSPIDVDEVVLVIRAFPIRVAGNSGDLQCEIDWKTVTSESGYVTPQVEFTSVTRKIRRVGRFEAEVVRRAIDHNRPTTIAMNHVDYVDSLCAVTGRITPKASEFVRFIERQIRARIDYLGIGPDIMLQRDHDQSIQSAG